MTLGTKLALVPFFSMALMAAILKFKMAAMKNTFLNISVNKTGLLMIFRCKSTFMGIRDSIVQEKIHLDVLFGRYLGLQNGRLQKCIFYDKCHYDSHNYKVGV